ncbi:MAG: hypothetical protein R3B54_05460 [Bdellovibrionota bacterium]
MKKLWVLGLICLQLGLGHASAGEADLQAAASKLLEMEWQIEELSSELEAQRAATTALEVEYASAESGNQEGNAELLKQDKLLSEIRETLAKVQEEKRKAKLALYDLEKLQIPTLAFEIKNLSERRNTALEKAREFVEKSEAIQKRAEELKAKAEEQKELRAELELGKGLEKRTFTARAASRSHRKEAFPPAVADTREVAIREALKACLEKYADCFLVSVEENNESVELRDKQIVEAVRLQRLIHEVYRPQLATEFENAKKQATDYVEAAKPLAEEAQALQKKASELESERERLSQLIVRCDSELSAENGKFTALGETVSALKVRCSGYAADLKRLGPGVVKARARQAELSVGEAAVREQLALAQQALQTLLHAKCHEEAQDAAQKVAEQYGVPAGATAGRKSGESLAEARAMRPFYVASYGAEPEPANPDYQRGLAQGKKIAEQFAKKYSLPIGFNRELERRLEEQVEDRAEIDYPTLEPLKPNTASDITTIAPRPLLLPTEEKDPREAHSFVQHPDWLKDPSGNSERREGPADSLLRVSDEMGKSELAKRWTQVEKTLPLNLSARARSHFESEFSSMFLSELNTRYRSEVQSSYREAEVKSLEQEREFPNLKIRCEADGRFDRGVEDGIRTYLESAARKAQDEGRKALDQQLQSSLLPLKVQFRWKNRFTKFSKSSGPAMSVVGDVFEALCCRHESKCKSRCGRNDSFTPTRRFGRARFLSS